MKQITQFFQLATIRIQFWLLEKLSPQKAASKAWQMMATPRTFPPKPREQTVLDQAAQSTRPYKGGSIRCYHWGNGTRTVLLVHGWEGQAGNFGAIVQSLLAQGWSVIAFDAPSHGQSDQQATSMFDFIECVKLILETNTRLETNAVIETNAVDAIIAHSFGCVATTAALSMSSGARVEKLIMIASPNRFEDRLQQMAGLFGLSPKTTGLLRSLIKTKTTYPIFDTAVSQLGDQINVGDRLLIHDKHDQVSMVQWSREIAQGWSANETANTTLIEVEKTGHNRILWDADTIEHITNFIKVETSAG